ncbi:hypothetical protein HPB50_006925 [Hyalomma asiaticum]|uniref:Uncharacterized protein n=1 Tax=Hyalomma asiaticum TaxID=266040 RepID=A0ACB7RMC5_HYAAI|nr:hypothetical protein HPB50_006925 [Hyalomma asiaticum]
MQDDAAQHASPLGPPFVPARLGSETTWCLTSQPRFSGPSHGGSYPYKSLANALQLADLFCMPQQAVSRDSERHSGEFTDAIGCFESKGDERPTEKEFGFFERIGAVHEEVTEPLDDHGGCRAELEREVGTIECVSPVGDTCGAGIVECHADDLVVREGSSQADANGVCLSEEENSARVLLLGFAVEQNEVLVPYAGVPEVDAGLKAQHLQSIADVNVSSVASPDARTNSDRTLQSIDMMEDVVPTLHGGCTSLQLDFECSDCWLLTMLASAPCQEDQTDGFHLPSMDASNWNGAARFSSLCLTPREQVVRGGTPTLLQSSSSALDRAWQCPVFDSTASLPVVTPIISRSSSASSHSHKFKSSCHHQRDFSGHGRAAAMQSTKNPFFLLPQLLPASTQQKLRECKLDSIPSAAVIQRCQQPSTTPSYDKCYGAATPVQRD